MDGRPALDLPAEDHELVAEHCHLEIRLDGCAIAGQQQAKDAAQKEVEDRADHGAALSQIAPPFPPSSRDRVCLPHGSGGRIAGVPRVGLKG
jgi:hypothetical protein